MQTLMDGESAGEGLLPVRERRIRVRNLVVEPSQIQADLDGDGEGEGDVFVNFFKTVFQYSKT